MVVYVEEYLVPRSAQVKYERTVMPVSRSKSQPAHSCKIAVITIELDYWKRDYHVDATFCRVACLQPLNEQCHEVHHVNHVSATSENPMSPKHRATFFLHSWRASTLSAGRSMPLDKQNFVRTQSIGT